MSGQVRITGSNVEKHFYLEPFSSEKAVITFKCPIAEYNEGCFRMPFIPRKTISQKPVFFGICRPEKPPPICT
jgi:hypothetical protein